MTSSRTVAIVFFYGPAVSTATALVVPVPPSTEPREAGVSATGGTSPQSGVVQRSSPSSARPSASGVNPSHPPKLRLVTPAGIPRTRTAPPESPTADLDVRGDHAREVGAVFRVEVLALLGHRAAPVDVAAVDLDRVADRDVGAGERPRARRDDPVAGRAQVHDVQVPPRNAVHGDHQVVQVRRRARVPGIRARGIPGGRAEDAAHGGAVRVVGHGALAGAVTGGGEHDRVPVASVEPAGTRSPELLAGEDRRVVHRGGAPRLRARRSRPRRCRSRAAGPPGRR